MNKAGNDGVCYTTCCDPEKMPDASHSVSLHPTLAQGSILAELHLFAAPVRSLPGPQQHTSNNMQARVFLSSGNLGKARVGFGAQAR